MNFNIFGGIPTNPVSESDITNVYVVRGINVFLFIITVTAIITVLISGINYITAGGDAEKTDKAKRMLIYAVVGLIATGVVYLMIAAALNASYGIGTGDVSSAL